ncbi:MAG TPA: hypothetical protein VNX67_01395 [Solirubrobacteraceae bacterium]|nr:hypothetical protein [Solirubrobacteraceae bacterium]
MFSPNRLGVKGRLQLTIRFSEDGSEGVPSPVRRSVLRMPAGLGIEIPHLRSCSIVRLRALGASGCSAQSELGRGHALAEAVAGSQLITENISLWLFLGPFHNLEPTIEILGRGFTPFDERVVLTGTIAFDKAPFGEDLVLSIPPIPTVPLEPDASILTMSLTVGTSIPKGTGTSTGAGANAQANTIVLPPACPAGGFPFAADFTYADGSSNSALAKAPCPGRSKSATSVPATLALEDYLGG